MFQALVQRIAWRREVEGETKGVEQFICRRKGCTNCHRPWQSSTHDLKHFLMLGPRGPGFTNDVTPFQSEDPCPFPSHCKMLGFCPD